MQLLLIFISFAVILFWFAELVNPKGVEFFAPFFNSIRDFIHLFYTRRVDSGGVLIDFSFLLAAFIMLGISYCLNFFIDVVSNFEKQFDKLHQTIKRKTEDTFNNDLEKTYKKTEVQNNRFLFFIKLCVKDLSKDKFYTKNIDDNSEENEKFALEEFLNDFKKNYFCETKFIDKVLLLDFKKFDDIDIILPLLEQSFNKLKSEYESKKRWKLDYLMAVDVYAQEQEIIPKIRALNILLKLNILNKVACLSSFKSRYILKDNPQYNIGSYGVYHINENEEVFCISKRY